MQKESAEGRIFGFHAHRSANVPETRSISLALQFGDEVKSCGLISLPVPDHRGFQFGKCGRVKVERHRPLRIAETCRRASAHGIGFTLPESSSRIRRAT